MVNTKAKAALDNSLIPIVCVGEHLDVRQAGNHVEHVREQLVGSLAGLSEEQMLSVVIAYEPVWQSVPARSPLRKTPRRCAESSVNGSGSTTAPESPSRLGSSTVAR